MAKMREAVIDMPMFKGVNTYYRPFALPPEFIFIALNVDFTADAKISQREGTKVIKQFDGQPNLFSVKLVSQGIVYDKMFVVSGNSLYVFNDDASDFDLLDNSLDAANVWGGIAYIDKFIFGDGKSNYIYSITDGSINAVDIHNSQNYNNSTGTIWEIFYNRVFSGGDNTENLYFSAIGDPTSWTSGDFIALDGRIKAIKAISEFLFVGTDNAVYKIIATGDSTAPFLVQKLISDGVVFNGIFALKGSMVGIVSNKNKIYVFDPYAKSGSQIDDSVGLPIFNILSLIDDSSKISIRRVNNKVYISSSLKLSPMFTDIKTIVFNENTFGWSFYNPLFYDFVDYKGNIYCVDDKYVRKLDDTFYQDEYIDENGNKYGEDFDTYIITPIYGGDSPEIAKNWRWLDLITVSKTKTEYSLSCAVNFAEYFKEWDSQFYYASDAYLGFNYLGSFKLGGSYGQSGKFRLDVNSYGLMLKIARKSSNSDFQLGRIKLIYYPSYRRL